MLTGCGTVLESRVPEQLDKKITNIQPNETKREMVRELLGNPIISSNYWNVEIYRTDTGYDVLLLLFFFPYVTIDTTGYILVTYDDSWVVSRYRSGFASDDIQAHKELSLSSDGYTFMSSGGFVAGKSSNIYTKLRNTYIETLIAPETLHDLASITSAAEDECILYLITEGRGYDIFLDNEELLYVPFISLGDVYFRISAPPGEHVIELMTRTHTPKSYKQKFSCRQGQELYVHTYKSRFRYKEGWAWDPIRNKMEVKVSNEYIEDGEGKHRRVIHHEGKWWAEH